MIVVEKVYLCDMIAVIPFIIIVFVLYLHITSRPTGHGPAPLRSQIPLSAEEQAAIEAEDDLWMEEWEKERLIRNAKRAADTQVYPVECVEEPVYIRPLWFTDSWTGTLAISPAEQLIINELDKYQIEWKREVSYTGLLSPLGGYLRYDFLLPDYDTLIEYQGKNWHVSPDRVHNDTIKAEFCKTHNLKLVILNSQHYYNMEQVIIHHMKRLGIQKKCI